MRQATGTRKSPSEKNVKDIKRATRKHYSSEEKTRIVLDGLRGEDRIAELCRPVRASRRSLTVNAVMIYVPIIFLRRSLIFTSAAVVPS